MRAKERQLLMVVGQINMVWDEIDLLLWYVFDVILGVHWAKSYSVFYSQQNSRNRRQMIESLAKMCFDDGSDELKTVVGFLKRVDKAGSKRNDLVHGVWTTTQKGRSFSIQRIPLKRDVRVMAESAMEISDLEVFHTHLVELHNQLQHFIYPKWAKKNAVQLANTKGQSALGVAFEKRPTKPKKSLAAPSGLSTEKNLTHRKRRR